MLRRIIRRAVRHGHQLGVTDSFFFLLTGTLCDVMGQAYPELVESKQLVEKVLKEEEEQFARTLDNGMTILEREIKNIDSDTLSGETVFQLYDTYGFPVDLTADVARERNFKLDMEGFQVCMEEQKNSARAASNFEVAEKLNLDATINTEFIGYDSLHGRGRITGIFSISGEKLDRVSANEEVCLLLDRSPFYAESGGQIGDQGFLRNEKGRFKVLDTQKQGNTHIHRGILDRGDWKINDVVDAEVTLKERHAITLNHSATHLMHAALRVVLGKHVSQKGSLVDAERLRFDFSHSRALSEDELKAVEVQVNSQILANSEVNKEEMSLKLAKKRGAVALFGEKYGERVRVVSMGGEFSIEFCGGCHVNRTGDIGFFKIISETGISAGIRRIEAVTGDGAREFISQREQVLKDLGELVKSGINDLVSKVRHINDSNRVLEKEIKFLKQKIAKSAGNELVNQALDLGDVKLLVAKVDGFNSNSLRDSVDQLKNKLGTSVIVLATVSDDKVSMVVGVSKDLTDKIKAGQLVNMIAKQVGGKGGGRPDMAMAGGTESSALPGALESVEAWVKAKL